MNLKDKKHAKMMNDFFEIFFDGKRDKIVNNIRDKEQQIFLYIMMHNEAVRRGTMCRELIVEIGNHFIEQFDDICMYDILSNHVEIGTDG